MTASAIDSVGTDKLHPGARAMSVHRSACYLGDGDESIFAWLHQSSKRDSVDHGVVICSPIGYEQLHSHRSLRYLADVLATQSIPTLRFDWHGTGDSPGIDQDPHRDRTWLDDIHQAVEWMRTKLDCRRISLVGLRLGATLATRATLENDIDNLVLWSPVIKGRSYVREMKAISLTAEVPAGRPSSNPDDIEAAGFTLSSATAAALSQFDLTQSRPQSGRVLVVSRDDTSEDDRLCHQWATVGIRVQQIAAPGYADMMAIPHRSRIPVEAISQITEWLTNEIHVDGQQSAIKTETIGSSSITFSTAPVVQSSDRTDCRIRESTWSVKSKPELFGILSEPKRALNPDLPTIVLLNAGAAHHIGPNRLNVFLARHLATQGFRCLRLDLSGIGDSENDAVEGEIDPYPETVFRDIDRTLTQLQRNHGARRIVLMGLCSGAYAAFQSASLINNPVLVESILINPLTYFWTQGMTIDESQTKHLRTYHYYKSVALDPRKWLKLLSGKSKIGIKGAVKLFARRLKLLKVPAGPKRSAEHRQGYVNSLTHPQQEDLPGDLQRITTAGRTLAMFFSKTDPGFDILNYHARRKASKLRAKGQLKIAFIENADHTFTMQTARNDLIIAIADHLRQRFQ